MAGSRTQGPIRFDGDLEIVLATTPGPLGKHRRTDTRAADHRADTPGPVGVNDASAVLASGLLATPAAARRPAARQADFPNTDASRVCKSLPQYAGIVLGSTK